MESEAAAASGSKISPEESQALNSTILDYYKKFGRKRDLEQYFSLNTAQGDIKDVSSLFWRRMKSQESSDSGEKSVDTSMEICRIQIKCSSFDPEPVSSQDNNTRNKSDSESPPIITEEIPKQLEERQSDDESLKSDDNQSQKSNEAILDTSINKAYSPSSSITSQRKLEWDSLADVGYANENDKRTSASTLSTLERLALQQQYSNNDTNLDNLGPPTAHSTPLDETDMKPKGRKGSKSTKIYSKDVEHVEVNVPQCSDASIPSQSINVNLTKHISFSVDKSGCVSIGDIKKDFSVSPEKKSKEVKLAVYETEDKEIQTSLIKTKDKSSSSGEIHRPAPFYGQGVPVLINLNNLKKRQRRRKATAARKKLRNRRKTGADKENVPVQEKSGGQVSDAESFEYMPGHIYNQNQMNKESPRVNQTAGNKSSLESSGAVTTTDSSKASKHSFFHDLENGIELLRSALKNRYDDTELKQKIIKEIVKKLINSNYRDDETSTEFLSGLSFSSKKIGHGEGNTTTSTSDANNTAEKSKLARPKKSILRVDKFNPKAIASTSQSAPNLATISNNEKPCPTHLSKVLTTSNSLSDASSKEKSSSDTAFAKTSSEELYQKYLDALRREEAYKKHLREKEYFLKQKLVASDTAFRTTTPSGSPAGLDIKSRLKLKELMKDLTRNNYDDGSGDASKLEGGFSCNVVQRGSEGSQRRHSVFTLSSSGNSDHSRKSNLKKSALKDIPKAGHSKDEKHYCCCPFHSSNKMCVTDSSVQVNIRCDDACLEKSDKAINRPSSALKAEPVTHIVSDDNTGEVKYLCFCNPEGTAEQNPSDKFSIYKCSRLPSKSICCNGQNLPKPIIVVPEEAARSRGSQTYVKIPESHTYQKETICVHEAVRVIQTDISINPRISDPSLSDIRITKNCDCVKLIREQFRQVSKTSVDTDTNVEENAGQASGVQAYNQPSTSSTPPSEIKKDDENIKTTNVETQSDIDLQDRETQYLQSYKDNEGYTIPIQGTNIALKVSVGANPIRNIEVFDSRSVTSPVNKKSFNEEMERKRRNSAVVTDKVSTVENATSLLDVCSKGVQSENKDLFFQYEHKTNPVNTIFSKQGVFRAQSNNNNRLQRKPFFRSNTFAGIEEGNSFNRNDILKEFYEQEHWATYPKSSAYDRCDSYDPRTKEDAEFVSSQNDLEDVVVVDTVSKADTSCGPANEIDFDPCPCPEHSDCGNMCGKYAECRTKQVTKQQLDTKEIIETNSRESTSAESVKKISTACGPTDKFDLDICPCPENADCGNTCGKDAECRMKNTRKQQPVIDKNDAVSLHDDVECNKETEYTRHRDQARKLCPEDTEGWNKRKEEGTVDYPYVDLTRSKSTKEEKTDKPMSLPLEKNKGTFSNDEVDYTRSRTKENKGCWSKESQKNKDNTRSHTIESPKNFSNGDIPPENSDSDYLDFQKLKDSLRSQRKQSYSSTSKVQKTNSNDLIMNIIKDVTNRYTKKDLEKSEKKKCFKEILSILNYLLDTEETSNIDDIKGLQNLVEGSGSDDSTRVSEDKTGSKFGATSSRGTNCDLKEKDAPRDVKKKTCDKGIQLSCRKPKPAKRCPDSSEIQTTSDLPCTSSDSVTCKVLSKIRNECEKYHQKCCKRHQSPKRCQCSSTTTSCDQCKRIILCQCLPTISVNCEKCKRVHHCPCRPHNRCKCKYYKQKNIPEKLKKKCVAYNLILQTSESLLCENSEKSRPLKNIIVKVPPRKPSTCNIPFREMEYKIGRQYSPRSEGRSNRSKSLPNDSVSSTDEGVKETVFTVKDYLEKNRPDFIEQTCRRQKCLKMIREARANNRAAQRELVSMQVQVEPALRALSESDLRRLARELGLNLRNRKEPPKLISEREMKTHSKKIYKKLPEVVQKKEDLKKENIKKTNLLLASIFKKNLQRKALRGSVNLSNYSTVIKI